jgi:hypothetical protein
VSKTETPPPAIDCARVISFARTDDLAYTGAYALYVDGRLVGPVPRLVIAQSLDSDDFLLFHCDESWVVEGVSSVASSPEEVKERAERRYPGLASRWNDLNVTRETAAEYLRATSDTLCSFCGRAPFEISLMMEREGARICDVCMREFHAELQTDGA